MSGVTWWGGSYSTEEQVIGKWIDGKPIYQKTINANMPSSTAETSIFSDSSIDYFISYMAMATEKNSRWKVNVPNSWGSSEYIRAYWDLNSKSFMIACTRADYLNGNITLTYLYTKITD